MRYFFEFASIVFTYDADPDVCVTVQLPPEFTTIFPVFKNTTISLRGQSPTDHQNVIQVGDQPSVVWLRLNPSDSHLESSQ
jgi:hypothetical protein